LSYRGVKWRPCLCSLNQVAQGVLDLRQAMGLSLMRP